MCVGVMVLEKQILRSTFQEETHDRKRARMTRQVTSEETTNWIQLARCCSYYCTLMCFSKHSLILGTNWTSLGCTSPRESLMCCEESLVVMWVPRRSPERLLRLKREETTRRLWNSIKRYRTYI